MTVGIALIICAAVVVPAWITVRIMVHRQEKALRQRSRDSRRSPHFRCIGRKK